MEYKRFWKISSVIVVFALLLHAALPGEFVLQTHADEITPTQIQSGPTPKFPKRPSSLLLYPKMHQHLLLKHPRNRQQTRLLL